MTLKELMLLIFVVLAALFIPGTYLLWDSYKTGTTLLEKEEAQRLVATPLLNLPCIQELAAQTGYTGLSRRALHRISTTCRAQPVPGEWLATRPECEQERYRTLLRSRRIVGADVFRAEQGCHVDPEHAKQLHAFTRAA